MTQDTNLFGEQTTAPFQSGHSEEAGTAWDNSTNVMGHGIGDLMCCSAYAG
ncbi:hypothetical protein [Candidatus Thiosymbion oneisti]|uniref:hypothetical protein n=1 Tax=Candidatus Thiosymbion oneisti TaxID=589554 RepID=UPI0013FE26D1|nr:hypothetical protein [Candidatus Thiosymbion oneisti]